MLSGSTEARTNSFHLRRASFAVEYRGCCIIKHVVYVVVELDVFVDVLTLPCLGLSMMVACRSVCVEPVFVSPFGVGEREKLVY